MYPVSAADVLNSVSSMLKRCVGFMMAKMVLRELMDPLIFLKFKSFLMKVHHARPHPPPPPLFFPVKLLNMKKNPIVSSCTTHHVLVLILIRKLYWHIEC
jgi:hypothetical protein